jgi:hypothetical protein
MDPTTMAKSPAERQAAYRRRHLKDIDADMERLTMMVSVQAKRQLERLSAACGISQRSMLESLLDDADSALANSLPPEARSDYYEKRLIALPANGSTTESE